MPKKLENIAARYIRENFRLDDRIAIVLINREKDSIVQRSPVSVKLAASGGYQAWLRYENAHGADVYVSMNSMRQDAAGRTKADIAEIRHVYLDFDAGGRDIVNKLLERGDLPKPNYVLESSPGRHQVIWKAQGFDVAKAEELLRGLARDTGADPAVTDATRVLRLPGYRNWKYEEPHFVKLEHVARGIARQPHDFPERLYEIGRSIAPVANAPARQAGNYGASQSERDFGYAIRHLKAGEDPEKVRAAIEDYRTARGDKAYPHRYAERTVQKAQQIVERENGNARGR
jgi:hypothetical protein